LGATETPSPLQYYITPSTYITSRQCYRSRVPSLSLCHSCNVGCQLLPSPCEGKLLRSHKIFNIPFLVAWGHEEGRRLGQVRGLPSSHLEPFNLSSPDSVQPRSSITKLTGNKNISPELVAKVQRYEGAHLVCLCKYDYCGHFSHLRILVEWFGEHAFLRPRCFSGKLCWH
jgi:hypothetical protein